MKLPNFLSVDCRPFDPEHYEDEIEDEDSLDEEGRARLKLKVENTIRSVMCHLIPNVLIIKLHLLIESFLKCKISQHHL